MDVQARVIKTGQMFPNVILQDEQGREVQIQDYRHHSNLVLIFSGKPLTKEFQQMLAAITKRYSEFKFEKSEVLAILDGTHTDLARLQAGQDYPFPLLLDPGGEAHREAGATAAGGQPAFTVVVLDRYCEIYAIYRVNQSSPRPAVQNLIDWLEYIGLQCDE